MTDHGCSHTWTAIGDTGWTRCRWCDTRIPPKSDTQVAPSPPPLCPQDRFDCRNDPCAICPSRVAPDSLVARLRHAENWQRIAGEYDTAPFEAADRIDRLELLLAGANADKARLVNARAEKDAERYRWLRDTGDATWRPFSIRSGYSAAQADKAIDDAIRAEKDS